MSFSVKLVLVRIHNLTHLVFSFAFAGLVIGAMVNPEGSERQNEWVTISNLGNDTVDMSEWTLWDTKRKPMRLGRTLETGESMRVQPLSDGENEIMLANRGGAIVLLDDQGRRVDRVEYWNAREGVPIVFRTGNSLSTM